MAIGMKRTAEMAAIFMVGDGVIGLLQPERHVALWRSEVAVADGLVSRFDGRPRLRRAYGIVQAAAGLWLASRLVAQPRRRAISASAAAGARTLSPPIKNR